MLLHGFKKWGMTTSNVATNIICDIILGRINPYTDIFLSTRFKPVKNGTEFVNMLKQVSSSLVIDKFKLPSDTLNNIGRDEGKILTVNGAKIGVYKDASR